MQYTCSYIQHEEGTLEGFKGRLAFGYDGRQDAPLLLIKCLGTGLRSETRVLIKAAGSRTNSLEIAIILYFGKLRAVPRAVTRETFCPATNYCIINC